MLTAKEARERSNKILKPVPETPEFKKIMSRIEGEISMAIDDGLESIKIEAYVLKVYNDYRFPKFINSNKIDKDRFWWPFVKAELERLGYKCLNTITEDTYKICW